jgi:hypothetical protein
MKRMTERKTGALAMPEMDKPGPAIWNLALNSAMYAAPCGYDA